MIVSDNPYIGFWLKKLTESVPFSKVRETGEEQTWEQDRGVKLRLRDLLSLGCVLHTYTHTHTHK